MPQISSFAELSPLLNKFMFRSTETGSYSLDNMLRLMTKLGNPQDQLKVIHVAGTSGKSSTCYYVASLLKQAGQKVGLTVSPHVDQINERVQVDLQPMPEVLFCQKLGDFIDIVQETGVEPSYFELLIAFAYWLFAGEKVDYAVVEVGLGGLLDGTNVINRIDKVCVITDLGLDHTNVLGNTLAEIASQKAGIIQSHNPVLVYRQSQDVMDVITKRCSEMHAQLHEVPSPKVLELANAAGLPPFQQRNWLLAEAVYNFLEKRDGLPHLNDDQLSKSSHINIPARMEVIDYRGQTLIIDGSHNSQKMAALVGGLKSLYPDKEVAALVGFVQSESDRAKGALEELLPITKSLIVTSFSGEQDTPKHSVDPKVIANEAKQIGFSDVVVEPYPAAAFAKLTQRSEPILLVTGSFYLLNHIRPIILKK